MKAMLSKQVGGPDTLVLEELPDPKPGAGEVLIAVKACGVNYPDLLIIEDRYQFKPPRPFAPGGEVAGIVEAVGDGVTTIKPGDRVIGSTIAGGMAEKLVVEAARCIPMPANMPFDEASALILTYATSIHALKDRAKIKQGETLLVLGAAGGVGLSAVELGKAYGARVIAAVSSPKTSWRSSRSMAPTMASSIRRAPSTRPAPRRFLTSSSRRAARRVRTSSTIPSAAIIPKPRCGRSPGRAGSWWSVSRPALPSCRST